MGLIYGTAGDDVIDQNYSPPVTDGDDTIKGGGGADRIDGLGGNDLIIGGVGADTMTGGSGTDRADYGGSASGVHVWASSGYISDGTGSGGDSVGDVFNDTFEIIGGSGYSDVLWASDSGTTLYGQGGGDYLKGGAGADYLDGGVGADVMRGGAGDDIYVVDDVNDTVEDDTGVGVGGTDTVIASITYVLHEDPRPDQGPQTGNLENLILSGSADIDGSGNSLANVLTGNTGKNTLYGYAGADTLDGGGGSGDRLVGAQGSDTYMVRSLSDIVDETSEFADGVDTVVTGITYSLTSANVRGSVENLRLTGTASIDGTGNKLDNVINGNSGKNVLYGLGGNDTFGGEGGGDTLVGGIGDDVYYVNSDDKIVENANEGFDRLIFSYGDPTFVLAAGVSVEQMELASAQLTTARNLTGNDFAQSLIGNAGENILIGGGGADTLSGGAATDRLVGGLGNDTFLITAATADAADKVIELANEGTDTVRTDLASYTLAANVERLYFTDVGAHVGRGNAGSNLINGNAGQDKFVIDAGGLDTFSGGSGEDTFDARTSATGLKLRLDNQASNAGAVAGDTFASVEKFFGSDTAADQMTTGAARAKFFGYGGNDTLTGGSSVDALNGGAGADRLYGNGGRDALEGGAGNDTMTGGADRDTFIFTEQNFGKDVVTDFQDGLDLLKVYSAVADDIGDFIIRGNGTAHVVLQLSEAPSSTISLDSASGVINLTASDFLFY